MVSISYGNLVLFHEVHEYMLTCTASGGRWRHNIEYVYLLFEAFVTAANTFTVKAGAAKS